MRFPDSLACALVVLAIMWVPPARAQQTSLAEAIDYALAHNPGLDASAAEARAAQERHAATRGERLPAVDLGYHARRGDNPLDAFADKLNTRSVVSADFEPDRLNDPAASEIHATRLLVQLPVYTGGRLDAQITQARERATAAGALHDRNRRVTEYQVTTAYRALQAAIEAEAIAADALQSARRHAGTSARLVEEGRSVQSDRLSAEVYLAAMEGMAAAAATRRLTAHNHLHHVTGMPRDAALTPVPWRDPDTSIPGDDRIGALRQQAPDLRHDRRAQQARAAAGSAAVDAARSAYRPQVSVLASSDWFDDAPGLNNQSWRVMGTVNLNLYSGGADRHRVAAARQELVAERARLAALDLAIEHDLRQAAASLHGAVQRYRIASTSVAKARRSVRLVDERYGQGRTILIDLIQAERALVDTRNEALAAALAVYNSRAALDLAAGQPVTP